MNSMVIAYVMNVIYALGILIVGLVAASWVRRLIRKSLERTKRIDAVLRPIIATIAYYTILVIVMVAVLARFGIQTASILALIGAAGLAVGLALQGALSNVASGVMLLYLRPFGIGDFIDADGIAGSVVEIGLFATELETAEGVYVMVPNTQLFGRAIKNFSRLPYRRIDVPVGVSYEDDVEKALSVALSVLKDDERVLTEKPAQVMVTGLGESSVDLNLRCWTERANYWNLLFDLRKAIKLRLDAEGISIPFPQRDVHMITSE